MSNIETIDFTEPISKHDALGYGKLPANLFWNTRGNDCVVGLYFDKKFNEQLKDEIHKILWFFGEFEEQAEEVEEEECSDENRCEECCHCNRTRPCECGECDVIGGTCEKQIKKYENEKDA